MKLRDYLKDLRDNIKRLYNVEDFSKYHLVAILAERVEFLGSVLCSTYDIKHDGCSNLLFNYAILKLDAFKEYRQYISIKQKISSKTILEKGAKSNPNILDCVSILNKHINPVPKFTLYTDFRCALAHNQRPSKLLSYTENQHEAIKRVNKKYILDANHFEKAFIDACDEILGMKDKSLLKHLESKFLTISDN